MNQILSDVITWVVTAGVGSLAALVTHKGLLGKVGAFVAEHAGQIEHAAVAGAEALVSTPAAKAAEVHLKDQLDKALSDLQQTTVGQLAAQALAAASRRLEQLTPEQVSALALHISTQLPAEWHVGKQMITDALTAAQKAADAIAGAPVVRAAAQFAAEVAAAQQQPQATPAQPAQTA
ncbi:MAG: hypothetical protein K6T78_07910 [Alicyclobacillus sp.]|nr:hypothetical protein [Alicyclobacillus sp.]